jgi:hypothetical protein
MGFGVLIVIRGAAVVSQGIARLLRLPPAQAALMATAACVGLVVVSTLSIPFAYGPKQDYLAALDFVEASKQPGDTIVAAGLAALPYKSLYQADLQEVQTLEDLNAIRSQAKRTWLLYTLPVHLQAVSPEITASIQRDFKVVKEFSGTLNGGTIFVCRSDILPTDVTATHAQR